MWSLFGAFTNFMANPPASSARAATSSSNPQGGKTPSAPGKCTGGPCSLHAPFTCLQLWQDVGCSRGCFFIDGCGWLEIRLPAPFDAPTHLLTPSPLLTPPWSSAPSFPPLWHFILPRTRLGYGKMIQTLRGVVGCGLVWSPRCTNPTATLQSPSQLLSQALKMCGKSSPWPESASLQGPRVNVTRVRPTRGSSAPSEWNFFRGFALKRQEAHGSKSY